MGHRVSARLLLWLALLVAGSSACEKKAAEGEEKSDSEKSACRSACGDDYKVCEKDCKNDAPEACESRCTMRLRKCREKCD